MARSLKVVIHAHTNYSYDANTSPEALVATARAQGVDCVAVTDHDEIDGALAARAVGGVRIIVGEEISSADGHIIGLFLEEWVPPGLTAEETARRIRAQGGLVLAPHPFATLCDSSLHAVGLARLRPFLDAVEIHNAQNPLPWQDARAAAYARAEGVVPYVGADTHIRGYLAAAVQVMPDFDGAAAFLAGLREAEFRRGRFGPGYFARMGFRHVWDRLMGRRLSGFGANVRPRPGARRGSEGEVVPAR